MRSVANALSRRENVKVILSEKEGKWAVDLKNRTLYYDDSLLFLDHDTAMALILHEVGHIKYTQEPEETQIIKEHPKASMRAINFLEDLRIDELVSKEYKNSDSMIVALNKTAHDDLLKQIFTYKKQHDEAKSATNGQLNQDLGHIVHQLESKYGRPLDPNELSALAQKVREAKKPNKLDEVMVLATLISEGYENNSAIYFYPDQEQVKLARQIADIIINEDIYNLDSTREIQRVWEDKIYPLIDIPPESSFPNSPNGRAPSMQDQISQKMEQRQESVAGDAEQKAIDEAMDGHTKGGQDDKDQMENLSRQPSSHKKGYGKDFDYNEALSEVQGLLGGHSNKLDRVLRDNSYERYSGRHRSGQLNKRRMYKYKTNDYKLFQRKQEINSIDYAFSILVDISGSMDGRPIQEAFKGLVLLSEILNRLGQEFSVTFFHGQHYHAKHFGQPFSRRKTELLLSETFGGGTRIERPVREVTKNLMATKQRGKVFICLTDGDVYGDEREEVKTIIEKHPEIAYYGLGIDVDLSDLFPNSIDVSDVKEIVPALSRIINKHLKR